jgi:hypothetical protein
MVLIVRVAPRVSQARRSSPDGWHQDALAERSSRATSM